jgi:hypothetical protein
MGCRTEGDSKAMARTLAEKVRDAHVVRPAEGEPAQSHPEGER